MKAQIMSQICLKLSYLSRASLRSWAPCQSLFESWHHARAKVIHCKDLEQVKVKQGQMESEHFRLCIEQQWLHCGHRRIFQWFIVGCWELGWELGTGTGMWNSEGRTEKAGSNRAAWWMRVAVSIARVLFLTGWAVDFSFIDDTQLGFAWRRELLFS